MLDRPPKSHLFIDEAREYCKQRGLPDPLSKFRTNQCSAYKRGIEWRLTFEEWWGLWKEHFPLRGHGPGKMMLCRDADQGPYAIGNVRIDTHAENAKEYGRVASAAAALRKVGRKVLEERFREAEHPGYIGHIFPVPLEFQDPAIILEAKQDLEALIRDMFGKEIWLLEIEARTKRNKEIVRFPPPGYIRRDIDPNDPT